MSGDYERGEKKSKNVLNLHCKLTLANQLAAPDDVLVINYNYKYK